MYLASGEVELECAMRGLSREQLIEVEFWRNSLTEGPDSGAVDNILHKCAEARILLRELRMHSSFFERASIVLELGAGQAWGSALAKREFPHLVTYASDISPDAVRSVTKWERVFS